MGRACGKHGGKVHGGFGGESSKQTDHLENIGMTGRIILK
jgi:hypothetical protein